MPQYTVKNAQGREVTFEWHGSGEPTDTDLEEVFAAAGPDTPAPAAPAGISDPRILQMMEDNPAFRSTVEGLMGGGASSASPTMIGKAVQQFAPGVSAALKGGAERMYGGLLKAKDATIERFPNVVKDLLAARVPITHGGRRRVVEGLRKIGGEKQTLLDAADQRAMVPRETLRAGLDDVLDDAIRTSEAPVKDLGKLAKIERDLIPDEPGVLPSRADKIKSKLQAESDRSYRQMKIGTRVSDTTAKAKTAVADRAKRAVETIEPRMEGVNARYASGKGQAEGLREALKRTDKHNVVGLSDLLGGLLGSATAGVPGGMAGVATMRALGNPNIGSRVAIGVNELGKIPNLDQATKAALLALLQEQR